MTVDSALDDRYAHWVAELSAWGYELEDPSWPAGASTIVVRARRPDNFADPRVVIDIREAWLAGSDPDQLAGLTAHGCYLAGASWNAQFSAGATGAERFDVDRSKPGALMLHSHPLGKPNHIRVAERVLIAPTTWLGRIEELVD